MGEQRRDSTDPRPQMAARDAIRVYCNGLRTRWPRTAAKDVAADGGWKNRVVTGTGRDAGD